MCVGLTTFCMSCQQEKDYTFKKIQEKELVGKIPQDCENFHCQKKGSLVVHSIKEGNNIKVDKYGSFYFDDFKSEKPKKDYKARPSQKNLGSSISRILQLLLVLIVALVLIRFGNCFPFGC